MLEEVEAELLGDILSDAWALLEPVAETQAEVEVVSLGDKLGELEAMV